MLTAVPERESLYRVLQVDPAASPLVIQAAYRVLARIFHPDVEGDDEEMKRINHAWAILGDPRRRAEYDRQVAGRHPGPVGASHAPSAAGASSRAAGASTWTTSPTANSSAAAGHAGATSTSRSTARLDDHAGPPQGEPFGPLLAFGRYEGWTLGQVSRVDRPFLEWLRNVPAGRGLKTEIDAVLQVRRGPGDERRHYETNQAKVHTWAPGAPTRVR